MDERDLSLNLVFFLVMVFDIKFCTNVFKQDRNTSQLHKSQIHLWSYRLSFCSK